MPTATLPLGHLIRSRMRAAGLTPSEFSRASGLSRQTVYQLFNGNTRITRKSAPLLAKTLGGTAKGWLRRQMDADMGGE